MTIYESEYNLDSELDGVLVLEVERGGLAAKNGVRPGDVITSVNNNKGQQPR